VIQSQGETLRIQLDAAFHGHNKPVFHADHLQIVLSFGSTLHTVRFPWESFRQVALVPLPRNRNRRSIRPHPRDKAAGISASSSDYFMSK
jgi:hypothetical protein